MQVSLPCNTIEAFDTLTMNLVESMVDSLIL